MKVEKQIKFMPRVYGQPPSVGVNMIVSVDSLKGLPKYKIKRLLENEFSQLVDTGIDELWREGVFKRG